MQAPFRPMGPPQRPSPSPRARAVRAAGAEAVQAVGAVEATGATGEVRERTRTPVEAMRGRTQARVGRCRGTNAARPTSAVALRWRAMKGYVSAPAWAAARKA